MKLSSSRSLSQLVVYRHISRLLRENRSRSEASRYPPLFSSIFRRSGFRSTLSQPLARCNAWKRTRRAERVSSIETIRFSRPNRHGKMDSTCEFSRLLRIITACLQEILIKSDDQRLISKPWSNVIIEFPIQVTQSKLYLLLNSFVTNVK